MKKTLIIAEIGQNHDGSLGILHSMIDALSSTGVDVVKFQMHIADAESSELEEFRVKFSYVDKRRIDYWRRMELSLEQWKEVKDHCESRSMEFLCSPFSVEAVERLELLKVKRYKIASGEVSNYLMLEKIAETKKEMILSSGMSCFSELDQTIDFISRYGTKFSVLQCTTGYPTSASQVGLNVIGELKSRYNVSVGLSDHSGSIYPCMAAAAQGADILEFHATFDKRMFGPDTTSSLTMDEIALLVKGVRFVDEMRNNPVDKNMPIESKNKKIFGKSLALRRDLKKGEIIGVNDLESKKPAGAGLSVLIYKSIVGKKAARDICKNEYLQEKDLL